MDKEKAMNRGFRITALACLAATMVVGGLSAAERGKRKAVDPPPPSAQAARLELYLGLWRVTQTSFDQMGKETSTMHGSEEVIWVLDKYAIRRTLTLSAGDRRLESEGMFAFNDATETYDGIWLSNWSTSGPTYATGRFEASKGQFVTTLKSRQADGTEKEYQVIERFPDAKTRSATTYEVKADGLVKVLEVSYRRSTPCPGGPRPIYDDEVIK